MKITLRQLVPFLVTFCLISLFSCEKSEIPEQESVTDYSKSEYWLSLPAACTKDVDIFYLYPASWHKKDSSEANFCAIDNPDMHQGSKKAFDVEATAFETVGNIFAPFYRQADAGYVLNLPEGQRWNVIDSIPAKDVTAAFDYYIKHYNNNKPFILVGHSEGANVLLLLLKNYMHDNPDIYSRMICAYVIGYPITAEFINANPHLKFAEGADDTGVIISYNTQSPSVVAGANLVMGNQIGLVINPINWKKDETLATVSESLGSYMPIDSLGNFGKVLGFADAIINLNKGVLECSSVNDSAMFKISGALGLGVYHSFDISFYYYNLRENAEMRINNFLGN